MSRQAISDLDEFLRRNPRDSNAFAVRALIYAETADKDRGMRDVERALALDPRNAYAFAIRGDIFRLNDQWDQALRDAGTAIRLNPKSARAYQVRGRAYEGKKEYTKALQAYTEAARLDPWWEYPRVARADILALQQNYKAALTEYRRIVNDTPKSEDAHGAFAWFLATCPDASFRDGPQAVAEATLACRLTQWKDFDKLDTLAAAYAEAGDFKPAVRRQREALAMGPVWPEDRSKLESRLALYLKKRPFRDVPSP